MRTSEYKPTVMDTVLGLILCVLLMIALPNDARADHEWVSMYTSEEWVGGYLHFDNTYHNTVDWIAKIRRGPYNEACSSLTEAEIYTSTQMMERNSGMMTRDWSDWPQGRPPGYLWSERDFGNLGMVQAIEGQTCICVQGYFRVALPDSSAPAGTYSVYSSDRWQCMNHVYVPEDDPPQNSCEDDPPACDPVDLPPEHESH